MSTSKIDDGGPVFSNLGTRGMSMRQWYAGMAISGSVLPYGYSDMDDDAEEPPRIAKCALAVADALIKAEKEGR